MKKNSIYSILTLIALFAGSKNTFAQAPNPKNLQMMCTAYVEGTFWKSYSYFSSKEECLANANFQQEMICTNIKNNLPCPLNPYKYKIKFHKTIVYTGTCPNYVCPINSTN